VISPSIQPDKLNNGVHPHLPHISLHGEGGGPIFKFSFNMHQTAFI